jgi:hypothetical protein
MSGLSVGANGGSRLGVSGSNQNSLAANTPVTIFTGATNTRGVWLRSLVMISAAASILQVTAGTAAPAASDFVTNTVVARADGGTQFILPRDLFIPPGSGLYVQSSAAGGVAECTFDIL